MVTYPLCINSERSNGFLWGLLGLHFTFLDGSIGLRFMLLQTAFPVISPRDKKIQSALCSHYSSIVFIQLPHSSSYLINPISCSYFSSSVFIQFSNSPHAFLPMAERTAMKLNITRNHEIPGPATAGKLQAATLSVHVFYYSASSVLCCVHFVFPLTRPNQTVPRCCYKVESSAKEYGPNA